MSENDENGSEVGYGRPPKHTRFKKGESGNPSGKRKGTRSRVNELERFLNETITVNEAGRRRQMRPMEIVRKKLFQLAAQGDLQAIKVMLELEKLVDAHQVVEQKKAVDFAEMSKKFEKIFGPSIGEVMAKKPSL